MDRIAASHLIRPIPTWKDGDFVMGIRVELKPEDREWLKNHDDLDYDERVEQWRLDHSEEVTVIGPVREHNGNVEWAFIRADGSSATAWSYRLKFSDVSVPSVAA